MGEVILALSLHLDSALLQFKRGRKKHWALRFNKEILVAIKRAIDPWK